MIGESFKHLLLLETLCLRHFKKANTESVSLAVSVHDHLKKRHWVEIQPFFFFTPLPPKRNRHIIDTVIV